MSPLLALLPPFITSQTIKHHVCDFDIAFCFETLSILSFAPLDRHVSCGGKINICKLIIIELNK